MIRVPFFKETLMNIVGIALTSAVLLASGVVAAAQQPLFTAQKLSRCDISSNVADLLIRYGDAVMSDTEKEILSLQDAASRLKIQRLAKAGLSFYCGKAKKLIPRIVAAEEADKL